MALDLTESAADTAEFSAVRDGTPPPEAPVAAPTPEATSAETPKPAAEAPKPEAAKPAEPPKRQEMVPHAALHEAREENKALKARLAALEAAAGKPAQPEAPKVDPETDPIAALRELKDWREQQDEQSQKLRELHEFTDRVKAHEADFAAVTPDYAKAVGHLRDARANELRSLGVPEAQIQGQLHGEAIATARFAFQQGKNPGEVFYALARARGYNPDAAPPPDPTPAPAADPTPAPDTKLQESTAALERINRGQRASRPTAGAGGNAPSGELTLEQGAMLEGAAFDKWFEANAKRMMN